MKTFYRVLAVAGCVIFSVCFFSATQSSPAKAEAENTFFCVKDFYDSNKNRDWWDRGKNSLTADGSTVSYLEDDRYMEVDFKGGAFQTVMWGLDDFQIPRGDRDWGMAKYIVNEVKNQLTSPTKYSIIVSTGKSDWNTYIDQGTSYYLKTPDQEAEEKIFSDGIDLPAGFEGYVVIPISSFPGADFSKTIRLSYGFFPGSACRLRLGRIGYAVSEKFLTAEEFRVCDETVYGIPDVPAFEKAPLRPSTEPASAKDNRYE